MKKIKKFLPLIAFNLATIVLLLEGFKWYAIIPAAVYWWYFCFLNRKQITKLVSVVAIVCLILFFLINTNIWVAMIPAYVLILFIIGALRLLIKQKLQRKKSEALRISWMKEKKKEILNEDGTPNFSKRIKLQNELNGVITHPNNKGKFKDEKGNII